MKVTLERWSWRSRPPLGRFGGGWSWKIGIQGGSTSVIVDLLFGQIAIRWGRR